MNHLLLPIIAFAWGVWGLIPIAPVGDMRKRHRPRRVISDYLSLTAANELSFYTSGFV